MNDRLLLDQLQKEIGYELYFEEQYPFDCEYFIDDEGYLRTLDLGYKRLGYIPSSVFQMNNLYTLILNDNQLDTLPREINRLKNLWRLYLWNNNLRNLPDEITHLVNLKTLNVNDNALVNIPNKIGNLLNLEELELQGNKLSKLPSSISNLCNLKILDLRRNLFRHLPNEILKLDIQIAEYSVHNSNGVLIEDNPFEEIKLQEETTNSMTNFSGTETKIRRNFQYDVTLSFAGEDRYHAEELAKQLLEMGISVFYDKYEQADLWGKDLFQHLQKIYRDSAKYCVIFVSKHYKDKLWPRHELRQAQERAFLQNQEYILPIRLDDTTLPGMNITTGYVDLRKLSIGDVTNLIVKKLNIR